MELHAEERKSRRLRKRKTYRDRKLVFLFFALFLAFFIISAVMFTVSMLKLWRENQNFKELAEISRASAAEAAYDEKDIAGNQDNQERFAELYERNKDFIG